MTLHFEHEYDDDLKYAICSTVLSSLPMWFGIPESTLEYCKGVKRNKFIKVIENSRVIGFISIKQNSELVSEIYVMGIVPEFHRIGIGTKLLDFLINDLKLTKTRFLEVKTLGEGRVSEAYSKTRQFYRKSGFIEFDTLLNEWSESNPCLIMLKEL